MPVSLIHSVRPAPHPRPNRSLPPVQVDLFGVASATLQDGTCTPLSGKAAALLALALIEPATTRRRAALMLWPDSAEPLARNNLRTLIHRLVRQIGVDAIAPGELLRATAEVQLLALDANAILTAVQAGGTARCNLLDDVGLDELDEFQAWLAGARRSSTQQQLTVLSDALEHAKSNTDAARTIALARACVLIEPMGERWHRQLMQTLAASGDRAAALAAYEDCRGALRENLGASPDESTRSLHVRILQSHGDSRPVQRPAAQGVALVERELPLQQIEDAISRSQHVALQGEAGVGKSRVLQQVCAGAQFLYLQVRADARHEPFAALAQLLQAAQQRHRLRLGRAERVELARIAPLAFPEVKPSGAPLSMARLRDALHQWADALRSAGVTALALDDVHCAHANSQAMFAELIAARDSSQPTLTVMLSHRSGEIDAVLAEAITAAQIQRRVHGLTLQRLSLQGIESLLHALGYSGDSARAAAADLFGSTAGNPLFVIELTLFSQQERVDDRLGAVGTNLEVLMKTRLAGCSESARKLAYVAGVALDDFSVELAAAVTESSALDLMPAWSELQLRGLFSENGLAHDLVRDAVMTTLPSAIKAALHRSIAVQLERSGGMGSAVLRHWLAVGDMARAFVHAEFALQHVVGTGQSGLEEERMLLNVIDGLQDGVLIERLWSTASLRFWLLPEAALERLSKLIERVAQIARSDDANGWVAFERARLLQLETADRREAYAVLNTGTARLQLSDVARAWTELWLCDFADKSGSAHHRHAQRAVGAARSLTRSPQHESLWRSIATIRMEYSLDHVALVRDEATRLRAARRIGDTATVQDIHEILAHGFHGAGSLYAAARHYRRARAAARPKALDEWRQVHGGRAGVAAMLNGEFTEAIACFEAVAGTGNPQATFFHVYTAWAWLESGDFDAAQAFADAAASPELDAAFSMIGFRARVVSRIARARGEDGVEPLRQALEKFGQAGPLPVQGLVVELALCELTGTADARIEVASRLMSRVSAPFHFPGQLTLALLGLAEAYADAGDAQCRGFALQGASLARRGHTTRLSYPPEVLTRFAAVLERSDPAIAASLTSVARDWVLRAMLNVPSQARHAFAEYIEVNRRLLAG